MIRTYNKWYMYAQIESGFNIHNDKERSAAVVSGNVRLRSISCIWL